MKSNTTKQYTIRNIPSRTDRALRKKARDTGKSFNQTVLDAIVNGSEGSIPTRDLSFIVGSISPEEAEEIDSEIRAQRKTDPKLWD